MTRCTPTTETRIVLRTILSAGMLAVLLLACAGTAAGATWIVDDDGLSGISRDSQPSLNQYITNCILNGRSSIVWTV